MLFKETLGKASNFHITCFSTSRKLKRGEPP